MSSHKAVLFLVAVVAVLGVCTASTQAGDRSEQSTFGSNFFNTSPPCPLRDFPTFESIVPIPPLIDPFEEDLIPIFCQIQVDKKGKPVKNAKGTFTSELFVIDNSTGMGESFFVDSGRFKTDSNGFDTFDFEIPTPIFADGFESGDVSAWSYTRSDFTKKKKADGARLQCGSSTSQSND